MFLFGVFGHFHGVLPSFGLYSTEHDNVNYHHHQPSCAMKKINFNIGTFSNDLPGHHGWMSSLFVSGRREELSVTHCDKNKEGSHHKLNHTAPLPGAYRI